MGAVASVLGFTWLLVGHASADAILPGGPCVQDSLSAYISNGSCTIEDKTFSFSASSYTANGSDATAPTAADITVTPIMTPGDPGFTFAATWSAVNPASSLESVIAYTVTVSPGGNLIEDASLALTDSVADIVGASVDVTETLCLASGVTPCPNATTMLHAFDDHTTVQSTDSTTFGPVGTVGVVTDIRLQNGSQLDTASLAALTSQFSEVPEPATVLLLVSGLVGLAALRRWR